MSRRFLLLNGLAILAVVCNHATQWGYVAMFWWPNRYRPVTVPNYDQLGSVSYYGLVVVEKLAVFCVPAFLFVSGFFVAYAARTSRTTLSWKLVGMRIVNLLIPYLIWSLAMFIKQALEGAVDSPGGYLTRLLIGKAIAPYFYVILLCQLYLLAPLVTWLAKTRWKQLLFLSGLVQFGMSGLWYLRLYTQVAGVKVPAVAQVLQIVPGSFFAIWVFFYVLGVVAGFRLSQLSQWLARAKWGLLIATLVLAVFSVLEAEIIYRATGLDWRASPHTLPSSLYAIAFVLVFLAFDQVSIPFSNFFYKLGSASFGIYLLHFPVLEFAARAIQRFLPSILAYQALFQIVLITLAVAVPLLLMAVVVRSPARKCYRHLFG